jgi:hypothetical protein
MRDFVEDAMPLADLPHVVNDGVQSSLSQTVNNSSPLRTDVAQTEQWTLTHRGYAIKVIIGSCNAPSSRPDAQTSRGALGA